MSSPRAIAWAKGLSHGESTYVCGGAEETSELLRYVSPEAVLTGEPGILSHGRTSVRARESEPAKTTDSQTASEAFGDGSGAASGVVHDA